jgi:hypothetical protein
MESLYLQPPFDITLHLPIAQVFQIQAGESRRAKGSEGTFIVGRYRDCYSMIEVCDSLECCNLTKNIRVV